MACLLGGSILCVSGVLSVRVYIFFVGVSRHAKPQTPFNPIYLSTHNNANHQAYSLLVTDKSELEGLPQMFFDLFAQNAAKKGHEGQLGLVCVWFCVVLSFTHEPRPTQTQNQTPHSTSICQARRERRAPG